MITGAARGIGLAFAEAYAYAQKGARMGIAADLVGMAVFLVSEDADYIVAQTYNVDGGNWMS